MLLIQHNFLISLYVENHVRDEQGSEGLVDIWDAPCRVEGQEGDELTVVEQDPYRQKAYILVKEYEHLPKDQDHNDYEEDIGGESDDFHLIAIIIESQLDTTSRSRLKGLLLFFRCYCCLQITTFRCGGLLLGRIRCILRHRLEVKAKVLFPFICLIDEEHNVVILFCV